MVLLTDMPQKVIQQTSKTADREGFLNSPSTPHQWRTQKHVKEIRLRVSIDHKCLYNEGRLLSVLLSETEMI